MILTILLGVVTLSFAGWRIWRRLRFSLHICQLHGYKVGEYAGWLAHRPTNYVLRLSHLLGIGLLLVSYPLAGPTPPLVLGWMMFFLWAAFFASSRRYRSDREKKALAWTNRMKRLGSLSGAFCAAPVLLATVLIGGSAFTGQPADLVPAVRQWLAVLLAVDLLAPILVAAAVLLLEPIEAMYRAGFKRRARQRLADQAGLTVIGITGSYGKTSVKFIIDEILSQRFQVLSTPGSYNTPMGICKVVNDDLRAHHQVLIVEMGMRHPGDIAELCDLVSPGIGVVTSVGVAHLETMGSIEAIAEEKGTLARRIPPDGTVVLNADDPRVAAMAGGLRASTVVTVSADGGKADLSAHDISYGPEGTSFLVRLGDTVEVPFVSRLLGLHNVTNILLGIAVGHAMGLRLRQMAHAVRRIQPVEHRLQLRREGSILVIDDAFNSNPVGARNAVEILGQFDSGRRVVVTPGMVELGVLEEEENRRLGEIIADHVDLAVLIGEARTRPIADGLRAKGFPDQDVRVFASLFDARDFLAGYLEPGDVVLYENDLPDQYDDAA